MIIRTETVNLDSGVKGITIFVSLLVSLLGIAMPVYGIITAGRCSELYTYISILFFVIICFVPVFMYAPKRVLITEDSLILEKGMGKLVLPVSEISDIEEYGKCALGFRTFGSGGFMGYIGKFYNKDIGHYTAYVGNCSEMFLVRMKNGKKYLLSCNNYWSVVWQIRAML